MIRIILLFFIIFFLCFYGIPFLRKLKGNQQITLIKNLIWSLVCAIISVSFLVMIVILF